MRRLLILPLVALALCLGACRQRVKEYDYPAWGFRISFASPPEVEDKAALPDGTPHSFTADLDSGVRDFAIEANDAPGTRDIDQLVDAMIPLMLKGIPKGEVTSHTYAATIEGLMGRQLDISVGGKPIYRVHVFLAGGRLYTIVAKSALGVDDPAVDQFLYSFHTLPGAPAANAAANTAAQ
jgi:hypothetical protein